jgi:pyruvate,water dikinase
MPETRTPIMLNVASPDLAFKFATCPMPASVWRGRSSSSTTTSRPTRWPCCSTRNWATPLSGKISYLINGYEDEETFFVKRLSYGIAKIAAAFYPNKVIVRFSDFKSNEYKNLLGGEHFEPDEENPMIGWRGASVATTAKPTKKPSGWNARPSAVCVRRWA